MRAIVAQFTAEERDAAIAELATLSVPDAVARVRSLLRPPPATANAARSLATDRATQAATPAPAPPTRQAHPPVAVGTPTPSGEIAGPLRPISMAPTATLDAALTTGAALEAHGLAESMAPTATLDAAHDGCGPRGA